MDGLYLFEFKIYQGIWLFYFYLFIFVHDTAFKFLFSSNIQSTFFRSYHTQKLNPCMTLAENNY